MPRYIELAPQLVRLYRLNLDCKEVIKEFLLTAVTADVRENVHAHWTQERLVSTGGGSYPVVRCSACQWQYPMRETKFCPNCGARMDESEEPTMEEYTYGQEGSEEDGESVICIVSDAARRWTPPTS